MRPCLEVWKPYRITPRVKKEVGDWVALHLIKRSMRTMLRCDGPNAGKGRECWTEEFMEDIGDFRDLLHFQSIKQKIFVNYVHICENLRLLLVSLNRRPRINFVRHSNFVHPPFPCVASSSLAALKFKKKRYRERSIWFLCLLWLLRFWLYMIGFMKISKEIERAFRCDRLQSFYQHFRVCTLP